MTELTHRSRWREAGASRRISPRDDFQPEDSVRRITEVNGMPDPCLPTTRDSAAVIPSREARFAFAEAQLGCHGHRLPTCTRGQYLGLRERSTAEYGTIIGRRANRVPEDLLEAETSDGQVVGEWLRYPDMVA